MTTAQLLIVCVTLFATAALAAGTYLASRWRRPAFDTPPIGAKVAIWKVDGQTLQGTFARSVRGAWVLASPAVLAAGKAEPLGGTASIPTSRIDIWQEIA